MSYLLDTNICSDHLKRPSGLVHFFNQHSGRLHISSIVLAELYAWAHCRRNPDSLLREIDQLLAEAHLLNFDQSCAQRFGEIHGRLLSQECHLTEPTLLIAATALVHDLTLVTHNTKDFQNVPDLRLEDWLQP